MMNLQLQVGGLYSHCTNGSSSSIYETICRGSDKERRVLLNGEIFLVVSSSEIDDNTGMSKLTILLGDKLYQLIYEDMSFARWTKHS